MYLLTSTKGPILAEHGATEGSCTCAKLFSRQQWTHACISFFELMLHSADTFGGTLS